MAEVYIKKGREKSLLRHHPWVFSGSVARVEGSPGKGETVGVLSAKNELLGWGAYNPESSIRIRMWTFDENPIDKKFLEAKMRIAISSRDDLVPNSISNAKRLIYGEADGIPGLIVDNYADFLVTQFLTAGIEGWKEDVIENLVSITGIENIYNRSDLDVRVLEGLPPDTGLLSGKEPPVYLEIHENGMKFLVDLKNGQKTGFFLDQRSNRKNVMGYSSNRTVMNCFCYTGGFSVNAGMAGAKFITSIDSSSTAIELAKRNFELNDLDSNKSEWIIADVFEELRKMRDVGRSFDVIILDPPKFAPTVSQVPAASRGYKDINLLAFKLLNPGGTLFTFSCSGGVNRGLFQKIVADAALDAEVTAQIIEFLSQDKDHPISLNFPESEYLKGIICQIK